MVLVYSANLALAAELKDFVGIWKWQGFKVEVKECKQTGVCAKVIAGPKNIGMKVFASEMSLKDGDFYGRIAHPQSGEVYNTRMRLLNSDRWQLNGCTKKGLCMGGSFDRVK